MRTPEERIAQLPEPIRKHVLPDDPYWCYVPEGWHDLVIELNNELESIDPNYTLHQVKEKFGGLRYYIDYAAIDDEKREQVIGIIDKYEIKSYKVCDVCGGSGKQEVKKGYVRTRCQDHVD